MILREEENVFLFKFGLIGVYFDIICADVVYPPGKKVIPIYSFLLQSNIFTMYIMQNTLAIRRIPKNFRNTKSFL